MFERMMRVPRPCVFRCFSCIIFLVLPRTAIGQVATDQQVEPSRDWRTDLSLLEEYRFRTSSSPMQYQSRTLGGSPAVTQRADHDVRLQLDGQISGPGDHFRGLLSTGLWWDVDGYVPKGAPELFGQQTDYARPWWALYTLSVEWQHIKPVEHLRLGRQMTEHGIPTTFDGASIDLRPWGKPLSLFAFGGRTVHFFETHTGLFENWMASAGVGYRPDERWRAELEYRFLHGPVRTQDYVRGDSITNHSYGLLVSRRSEQMYAKGFVRGLDNKASLAGGALLWEVPSLKAGVEARLSAQLSTLGEVSETENPYFSILGPSLPHVKSRLELWKDFAFEQDTTLSVHLGWRLRQLVQGQEGPFNRNAGAIYLLSSVRDFGVKGLFATAIGEWHYIPWSLADSSFFAVGGAAGFADKTIKCEVGTYYQRFKVNYYRAVEELQDDRTVYGMFGYWVAPWLEVRARYELDVIDRYIHSVFLSMRQTFDT